VNRWRIILLVLSQQGMCYHVTWFLASFQWLMCIAKVRLQHLRLPDSMDTLYALRSTKRTHSICDRRTLTWSQTSRNGAPATVKPTVPSRLKAHHQRMRSSRSSTLGISRSCSRSCHCACSYYDDKGSLGMIFFVAGSCLPACFTNPMKSVCLLLPILALKILTRSLRSMPV